MRSHGVPHPNPDRKGDFHFTLAQERRMKTVRHAAREAAAKACFHTQKGLDMRPLTREAQRRALAVLADVKRCLVRRGHVVGKPIAEPARMGRWMFGFDRAPSGPGSVRDEHVCERSMHLPAKLARIIADDRAGY